LPAWMCILIVGREFAVSGLRSIAAAEGYTIKANDMGKTKMVSQVAAISAMLFSMRHAAAWPAAMALMWVVVFFSMLSAISYFRKFWRKIDERVKLRRRRELLHLERKRQRELLREKQRELMRQSELLGQSGSSSSAEGLGATIWKPPEVS
jgi:CDP-diacylglycerol---glycerol-3-phosphate 3-phosphatidyltransferase